MSRLRERASLVMEVGGGLMGLPEIADEALDEFQQYYTEGDDPERLAWAVFMDLLYRYDLLEKAFSNAWPRDGVAPFATSKGLTPQDAEDISQKTAEMAWRQFRDFKPYRASWSTWILMIAERRIYNFWRDTEKEKDDVDVDGTEILYEMVEIDRPGWSVPKVCEEWIQSGDERRARFASIILQAYYNLDWVPPGSSEMASFAGMSKKTCMFYFRWFTTEVINEEMVRESKR